LSKKILIVGHTLKGYPRNDVLVRAWQQCAEIVVSDIKNDRWRLCRFAWQLFTKGFRQDLILIVQPAQFFIFPSLVFKFFYSGQIICDNFISIYDTYIYDRRLASQRSVKAFYYYLMDWLCCRLGDILIFDTNSHKDYFIKTFHLSLLKKMFVLPVAVDWPRLAVLSEVEAGALPQNKFNVLFWGNYIPLQGIEYILKAANLLREERNIHFTLIGNGQTKKQIFLMAEKLKLDNVTFLPPVEYEELFRYVGSSDICLGIFGQTDKARRVIPNKVLEAMACGKVLVTGYNQSIADFFRDGRELIFCQMADSQCLAQKIFEVYKEPDKFKGLGIQAQEVIKTNFSQNRQIEIIKSFL